MHHCPCRKKAPTFDGEREWNNLNPTLLLLMATLLALRASPAQSDAAIIDESDQATNAAAGESCLGP